MHDTRPDGSLRAAHDAGAPNTACSACGAPLHCGARAGASTCWCASWPAVTPVAGETCLCPRCLSARVAARQEREERGSR
jgi:hypothetical protein